MMPKKGGNKTKQNKKPVSLFPFGLRDGAICHMFVMIEQQKKREEFQ